MSELKLTLIPELETEQFEYAIAADVIFFKMKKESNWHTVRPSTLVSQLKTLAHEVKHLKGLLDLQTV